METDVIKLGKRGPIIKLEPLIVPLLSEQEVDRKVLKAKYNFYPIKNKGMFSSKHLLVCLPTSLRSPIEL